MRQAQAQFPHWREFLLQYGAALLADARDGTRALLASLRFDPEELRDAQFLRYALYRCLREELRARLGSLPSPRVLELGGSNGTISAMLPRARYEVAPNWPEVDVQDLSAFAAGAYDAVVLDNILEHVQQPERAVLEVHRILRGGGLCICLTPFLIRVHDYPGDYWRFTDAGLRELFKAYDEVNVTPWGNRFTLKTILRHGWLSARNTKRLLKVALWNDPDWPIEYLTLATK
jgi:SAM-dependent methyltransferase